MSEPFIGELRMMSFNFAPTGWAMCNGQLLPIQQNQALFALLGTTYGGDGVSTFALPNLQGKTPLHMGNGFTQGQTAGEQNHTLLISELPVHTHTAQGSTDNGSSLVPGTTLVLGAVSGMYGPPTNLTGLAPGAVGSMGGSQAHPNMQPYIALSFCIALTGLFPSRN